MENEILKNLLAVANDQKLRPDLTSLCFLSEDRVQATNLQVWLDCSHDLPELSGCNLPASEFVKAYEVLDKSNLKIEKTNERLILKDKAYSIKIPLIKVDDFPSRQAIEIDYQRIFSKSPLEVFRKAASFIDRECSYPFAKSFHILDGICYVIGHAFLIGFDIKDCFGSELFDFEISISGIDYSNKYGREILSIQQSENGTCIFFDDGNWLYSRNSEAEAPDFRAKIKEIDFAKLPKISQELKKAISDLDQLSLMSGDYKHTLYFGEGVSTAEGDYFASANIGNWKESIYSGDLLVSICSVADCIDFSQYPQTIPFCSEDRKIFGIFMGRAR